MHNSMPQMHRKDIEEILVKLQASKGSTIVCETQDPKMFKEALSRWKNNLKIPGRLYFSVDAAAFASEAEPIFEMTISLAEKQTP